MYAGTGLYKGKQPAAPSISVLRRDDGQIAARVVLAARCKGYASYSFVVKAAGSTPDGVNFTAAGSSKLGPGRTVRVTLTGSLAPDAATGSARVRLTKGCKGYTQPFALRTESAPAGAPAVPAAGTVMLGLTAQSVGGLRLPVSLRATGNGRVYAVWQGLMTCGRAKVPILDFVPSRKVGADGSFGGRQRFTVRYRDHSERYVVDFHGQFRADGATGTLRARMQWREGKRRFVPCDTGAQTWTARP